MPTHCHFCNIQINNAVDGLNNDILKSNTYMELLNDESIEERPKRFILSAYLNVAMGNHEGAGFLYLKAAWMFDDLSEIENTEKLRKISAKHFKKHIENTNNININVMLVDIMRRAGEFDEAEKYANNILKSTDMLSLLNWP